MSQANIELMATAINALMERDADALDGVFHEDVEWRPSLTAGGAVERAVYRGPAGMAQYLEDVDV
ncbi:MAG: hypothetical protein ABIZ50_00105, partial [Solirubrobacterales bacterium]